MTYAMVARIHAKPPVGVSRGRHWFRLSLATSLDRQVRWSDAGVLLPSRVAHIPTMDGTFCVGAADTARRKRDDPDNEHSDE
jgi:hypothetical protein